VHLSFDVVKLITCPGATGWALILTGEGSCPFSPALDYLRCWWNGRDQRSKSHYRKLLNCAVPRSHSHMRKRDIWRFFTAVKLLRKSVGRASSVNRSYYVFIVELEHSLKPLKVRQCNRAGRWTNAMHTYDFLKARATAEFRRIKQIFCVENHSDRFRKWNGREQRFFCMDFLHSACGVHVFGCLERSEEREQLQSFMSMSGTFWQKKCVPA
jgi:hypothetical protein